MLTHECKGNASYKHLSIKQENIDLYYKNKPRIFATVPINFYFCKPYHSWERGANENTNGLIRQYIPKGTDFSEVTNKRIKWIENNLNNRPRKRLGYLTPNEKFKQIINMNSVAFVT